MNALLTVVGVAVSILSETNQAKQSSPPQPQQATVASGLPAEMPRVANYHLAAPDLAVAGVPDEASLRLLRDRGLKTVVDLRTEKEGTAGERAFAEALGLRYVSVPVSADTLSLRDADAVVAALEVAGAKPALLHCASSNRSGAIWALLEARRGKTPTEAEEEGRRMGLRPGPMTDALRRVFAEPQSRP